jgi:uncharacterized protein YyaL (SSP411 family)
LTNRLSAESSPYLRQHAENPVDWFPWGPEALALARERDVPVLVSIGYSACHWCHVMAHESFEDPEVAGYMNRHFVNVKVDREERPDVDAIYMDAVQALSGSGGWPLNVFLTPDGRPFFGGTYFPPEPRHGLPGWRMALEAIAEAYAEQRQDIDDNAGLLSRAVTEAQRAGAAGGDLDSRSLEAGTGVVLASEDREHGGFGGAPKFPSPLVLEFLLMRHHVTGSQEALLTVRRALDGMAAGGLHDQVGGGFHRYTVDGVWLVPHFEKMLYDNAMLSRAYLHGYLVTRDERYRHVAIDTLDYLLRDMRSPDGAFYASEDADSEGGEGAFYVWRPEELDAALSTDQARFARTYFDVTKSGNFEGATILTSRRSLDSVSAETGVSVDRKTLEDMRAFLLRSRAERSRPGVDRKILVSWNALAIRALAEAGRSLRRSDYLRAATRAARFILDVMRPSNQLVRSHLDGAGSTPAFLDDYASLIHACITLSEVVPDLTYFDDAVTLSREMIDRFWSEPDGSFFDATESSDLFARPRSLFDSPTPSGNGEAATALIRLAQITGDDSFEAIARSVLGSASGLAMRVPLAVPTLLSAGQMIQAPWRQIAIATPPGNRAGAERFIDALFDAYRPFTVLVAGPPDSTALLRDRAPAGEAPTVYVCERFTCRLPVTSVEAMLEQVEHAPPT